MGAGDRFGRGAGDRLGMGAGNRMGIRAGDRLGIGVGEGREKEGGDFGRLVVVGDATSRAQN